MNAKLKAFIFVVVGVFVTCEIPANNWHSYLSYYQIIAVTQGGQQIFAASENGLFSYNPSDKSFETKSRVEGLSDSGISAIGWSNLKGALLIGYSNGNLDLLLGNTILNLPDLKLKTSIANKSINNILCEGDFAWLSCNFGIVKINLKKWEVAKTWVIGPDYHTFGLIEKSENDLYFSVVPSNPSKNNALKLNTSGANLYIAGNLAYKTTSIGRRAVWNGKNRNGARVSSGVYLTFCADHEGNQSPCY